MKRLYKLLQVLLGVVLLGGGIAAVRRGWNWYGMRQVNGRLSHNLPADTYSLAHFTLTWDDAGGGALRVSHRAQPDKVLWASLPGRSFVGAGRGRETVEEERGSFFISDDLSLRCGDQTIAAINQSDEAITVSGELGCANGERVGYTLTFSEARADQLAFDLTLDDPRFNRTFLTYAAGEDEHFFGFGEQFSFFDFKGKRLPIFVMEQGIGRGAQPITAGANIQARAGGAWHTTYAGVPHYITSQLRSLFLTTYEYVVFDLRRADRVQIQLFAPRLQGRILYGDSPAALIESYTAYAGRMRPLPDWLLEGAVIGMQGGTEKVRRVWQQLQAQETPVAAFWLQDWVGQRSTSFGTQLWWNWELDQSHYPGWSQLVADLAADDIRVLTYVNPFLADRPDAGRNLFHEAAARGYLVQNRQGDPYLIQNSSFSAGLLDLTNPDAWVWMKAVMAEEVVGAGADGWMADFGEGLPYDAVLHEGTAVSLHNRYPELWAQLNREVIDESGRGDELVFFLRSGYTRSPRYATLFWAGDQLVSWDRHDGIKTAVIALLTGGLSGFSLNHSDIGGYTTITHPIRNYHRSKELLLRWMDLSAFTLIYRTHEGNRPAENHQFYTDEETLAHFSRMAQVYNAWAFYRRPLMQEAVATGLPVIRHPFIHYPNDPTFYDFSYQQFMIGDQFMVAPVLDANTDEVEVYLPAGRWVHLWTGDVYGNDAEGSWVTVAAPLGETAVFYPEGSAVGRQFAANPALSGLK